jgi:hypothetical protein
LRLLHKLEWSLRATPLLNPQESVQVRNASYTRVLKDYAT